MGAPTTTYRNTTCITVSAGRIVPAGGRQTEGVAYTWAVRSSTRRRRNTSKELVESAVARQRLEVGSLTSFYLVNLLCGFVRFRANGSAALDDEPLALRLAQALESGGIEQRAVFAVSATPRSLFRGSSPTASVKSRLISITTSAWVNTHTRLSADPRKQRSHPSSPSSRGEVLQRCRRPRRCERAQRADVEHGSAAVV